MAVALTSGGCGILMPYDHVPIVAQPAPPTHLQLAGDAENALLDAEKLRLSYYRNLQTRSVLGSGAAAVAIGLTGWALYGVIEPNDSGNPYVGDRRRAARLGVAIAGLYAVRSFFTNSTHEKAYANGYRSLTCLMYQSSPLLMTEVVPPERVRLSLASDEAPRAAYESSLVPRNPFDRAGAGIEPGDVERLEWHLNRLNAQLFHVRELVAKFDARLDAVVSSDPMLDVAGRHFRARSTDAKRALNYATNAWFEGGQLLDAGRQSGMRIRAGVALIASETNVAIQGNQNELGSASELFSKARTIGGLTALPTASIGADTEADQTELKSSAPVGLGRVSDYGRPPMVTRIPVRWSETDSAPRMMRVADMSYERKPTCKEPVKADASSCAPTADKEPAKPPGITKPKGSEVRLEDLKAFREKLDATIKAQDDKAAVAKAEKQKKLLEAFEKTVHTDLAKLLGCTSAMHGGPVCIDTLVTATERLYALRRPVAQALLNYRERTRHVAETPECVDLMALRVVPSDPQRAVAGSTIEFIVHQKDRDLAPLVVLQGPTEDRTGATVTIKAIEASKLLRVTVALGAEMASQRLRLIVSDSTQRSTQVVAISVAEDPTARKKRLDKANAEKEAAEKSIVDHAKAI